MTQTYSDPRAIARMRSGLCPECGTPMERHTNDPRFWMPRWTSCDLMQAGVADRIAKQRELDAAELEDAEFVSAADLPDDVFPEWDAAAELADEARRGK